MSTTDRDNKLAHDLIAEHFDRDNMGRLREAIATALITARTEQAERDAQAIERQATVYRKACAALKDPTATQLRISESVIMACGELAAAIRAGVREGK